MNQREINRYAKWRAGLILQSVLADGWHPQDLVDQHGDETTDRINEAVYRLSLRMAPGDGLPTFEHYPDGEQEGGGAVIREIKIADDVVLCLHPDAVSEVVAPPGLATRYFKVSCPRCDAWGVSVTAPPALTPTPITPPRGGTTKEHP